MTEPEPPQPSLPIRERICAAGTRLFCQKGYGSTPVSEIVAAAGVTKPVLYYYFGSKAGLFEALFASHFGDFALMLERAGQFGGSLRDKLSRLTRDQFDYASTHVDRLRFVLQAAFSPQHGVPHERFAALMRSGAHRLHEILAAGIARAELKPWPVDQLGLAYLGMVHMYLMRHLNDPGFALDHARADRLVELFLDGAGPANQRQESGQCA